MGSREVCDHGRAIGPDWSPCPECEAEAAAYAAEQAERDRGFRAFESLVWRWLRFGEAPDAPGGIWTLTQESRAALERWGSKPPPDVPDRELTAEEKLRFRDAMVAPFLDPKAKP